MYPLILVVVLLQISGYKLDIQNKSLVNVEPLCSFREFLGFGSTNFSHRMLNSGDYGSEFEYESDEEAKRYYICNLFSSIGHYVATD